MTLKGKTAVITGSNSGIGLGVAEELAKAGADVAMKCLPVSCLVLLLLSNAL